MAKLFSKSKIAFGYLLAMSTDMAVGIFYFLLIVELTKIELGVISKIIGVAIAAFVAISPDLYFIVEKFKKGKMAGEHKKDSKSHAPIWMFMIFSLIFILICILTSISDLSYLIKIRTIAISIVEWLVSLLSLSFHYIHDLEEDGPGIWLFWPFDKRRWQIKNWHLRAITKTELEEYYKIIATEWVKKEYLVWRPRPIIGAIALVTAVTMVIIKMF